MNKKEYKNRVEKLEKLVVLWGEVKDEKDGGKKVKIEKEMEEIYEDIKIRDDMWMLDYDGINDECYEVDEWSKEKVKKMGEWMEMWMRLLGGYMKFIDKLVDKNSGLELLVKKLEKR